MLEMEEVINAMAEYVYGCAEVQQVSVDIRRITHC